MLQISPTLLTNNNNSASFKLTSYLNIFKWIQLDIIDGIFADNKTLTLADYQTINELNNFKKDVHLMVKNPIDYLSACQKIKPKRVIGQIEMMADQEIFIKKAKTTSSQIGLAVDLPTALERLNINLIAKVDLILLMSVKAGFGGQPFSPLVIPKIKKLAKIKKQRKLNFKIALDGGINPKTIKTSYSAGAEIFYVGGFLEKEPKKTLKELKAACL
jgi:ribulose-phosphate 3-epimerase